MAAPIPRPVAEALVDTGAGVTAWRTLQRLTTTEVADAAGLSRKTVEQLERGHSVSLANYFRVLRVLGVLERSVAAVDPLETDVGRARAADLLYRKTRRVR
jgi:transcriptional regulator with XRE-family HTH domain